MATSTSTGSKRKKSGASKRNVAKAKALEGFKAALRAGKRDLLREGGQVPLMKKERALDGNGKAVVPGVEMLPEKGSPLLRTAEQQLRSYEKELHRAEVVKALRNIL